MLIYYFYVEPHSPPTSIEIPSTDKRTVTISWQPPIPEDRNGIITYYLIVVYNLDFMVNNITVNVSGTLLSYTVTGLEEYSTHRCEISAGTSIGSGPFSSPTEFMTTQNGNHCMVIGLMQ